MSEERKHDIEIEIAAPGDLVWKAITEAEGLMRWFAPEVRVEPGEGGSVFLSWGQGMEGKAPITVWEAGKRFAWTEDHGGRPRVVEIVLEGEGGSTRLRLVHSGFGAEASFDTEYESTSGGWHTFLAMLRYGLEHHPGESAANVTVLRMSQASQPDLWLRAREAAGLPGDPIEGAPCRVVLGGTGFDGLVARSPRPGYLCIGAKGSNALVSIFAESCGGASVLTAVAILFGEAASRRDTIHAALTAYADEVVSGLGAGAAGSEQ